MGRSAGLLLAWVCWLLSVLWSASEGGKCHFPFHYKSGVFYDCVKFKAKHRWCSLHRVFQGFWKYCAEQDLATCIFPFWYGHTIYWECTDDSNTLGRKWCSLTQNYNKEKVWKYCDEIS
ncbi:binder of sperm protein homolog 1-like [Molossus nigricans]